MGRVGADNVRNAPGRRILLIGRERAASEATGRYLEYCGHEVTLAEDAASALLEADSFRPHVLICDLNLDSGRQRVRAARQIQQQHHSAIVIISEYRCADVRNRFSALNVVGCLRKPVSLKQLAEAVASAKAERA